MTEPGAAPPPAPLRVALIGSGNWGSAVARIVGANVARLGAARFAQEVRMYTYEETLADGRKLTEVVNSTHENVKYLPGHRLPELVVAEPSLRRSVAGADLLVWVVPHNFLPRMYAEVRAGLLEGGRAEAELARVRSVSLIKGCDFDAAARRLVLISESIRAGVGCAPHCEVLMGANVANEVADGHFCEATLGFDGAAGDAHAAAALAAARVWRDLFDAPAFRVRLCRDRAAVELCGALKNVVALAAGFVDGLGLGGNTKAAVMRIGLLEMLRFCRLRAPGTRLETFFESCGVADLITTCAGGRNRKCAAAFVQRAAEGVTWAALEAELLGGQKLQGTGACEEVCADLASAGLLHRFPLFAATLRVMHRETGAQGLVDALAEAAAAGGAGDEAE
jgi:glycerol-3-phosphate dehydrogenase (NAD+)